MIATVTNCISIPLTLILIFFLPAILIHSISRGTFVAGFEIGAIWRIISRDWGRYLLVFILYFVSAMIANLGTIACLIGVIFTWPSAFLIGASLAGQLARRADGRAPTVEAF